jgi:hypothetical protein
MLRNVNLSTTDSQEKIKKYAAIREEGINSIVTTIMVPISKKITKDLLDVLFNSFMIF